MNDGLISQGSGTGAVAGAESTLAPPFVERRAVLACAAEIQERLHHLQRTLAEQAIEAALIVQSADLFYYTGTIQQSYLVVPVQGEVTLFTRKSAERARHETPLPVTPLPSLRMLPDLVRERYGRVPRRLGLELDVLPVNTWRRLEALFDVDESVDIGPWLLAQRAVKSAFEIERIVAAGKVTLATMERIPEFMSEGVSEVELAGRIEAVARALGHQGVVRMRGFNEEMFYGQLLTGVSATVPSYLDTPLAGTGLSPAVAQGVSFKPLQRGEPFIFDFVSVIDGYMADFTRIFSLGPLPVQLRRAYEVALRVEQAVVKAARPGVTCRALYERALAVADAEGLRANFMGYGEGQVKFIGHGVGIELDELPVIAPNDRVLEEGMVFALEPKFVLPGLGAIGVENTWTVTASGLELLTDASEELRVL